MDPSFWDERYRSEGYVYGREPNDFVRAEAHRIPPGPVLCIAEGEGRNAAFLAKLGHEVTAVDYSREALRKLERLARDAGVEVTAVHADLETYEPPENAYSGIVSSWAHMPAPIRKRVHGWIPRALRPGGVLLLEAYTPAQLAFGTGGPKDVTMLMTLAGLKQELSPLVFELGRELERDVNEGDFHGGRSATVQVAAVRR